MILHLFIALTASATLLTTLVETSNFNSKLKIIYLNEHLDRRCSEFKAAFKNSEIPAIGSEVQAEIKEYSDGVVTSCPSTSKYSVYQQSPSNKKQPANYWIRAKGT